MTMHFSKHIKPPFFFKLSLSAPPAPVIDLTPIRVPYVIVGAGTAAYYAAVGIKRRDKNAQVG